ncbi:hypothetical protein QYF36_000534 [Acer negundo]|nr:hypothetical protein QYF36_000534 [Acer negundo]
MWRDKLTQSKHLKAVLLAYKDESTITKIHAFMIKANLSTHRNSVGRIIASYARIDIASARKAFDELPQRGVDAFNVMIIACSRKESPFEACVGLMDLKLGEQVWHKAVDFGYENDVFVGSSLLNLYAKCGKMDKAMPREAVDMYKRMRKEGIEEDVFLMVGLVQACANLGDSKLGLSLHGYMIRRNLDRDVIVQTSLVDMHAKNGHMVLASHVFKDMSRKNVVSWGALISGFAQNGLVGNALEFLVEMQSCGFEPDSVSLMSALLACAQIGFLKLGKSVHGWMDSRDLISWNVIIASYGVHGYGMEALSLFLQMIETKLKPDSCTFSSLLSALSHSGLVEEDQYWFDLMVSEYKIQPSEKHYAKDAKFAACLDAFCGPFEFCSAFVDELDEVFMSPIIMALQAASPPSVQVILSGFKCAKLTGFQWCYDISDNHGNIPRLFSCSKILSMDFKNYKAEIKTADAQNSHKEGVTLLVTGCLAGKDNLRRKFAQSFFLAPQDNGYFVLNDVFRYVEDSKVLDMYPVNIVDNSHVVPSFSDPESARVPDPPAADHTTSHVEEDQNISEEVYEPSEHEIRFLDEKEVLESQSHEVEKDVSAMVELVPSSVQEDAPKKSYASIIKVTKGSSGPNKIYVPTNTAKVTRKKTENQPLKSATPASHSETSAPVSTNIPESSNAHDEAESCSIYIRNLPFNITSAELEVEFKKFGPIKQGVLKLYGKCNSGWSLVNQFLFLIDI